MRAKLFYTVLSLAILALPALSIAAEHPLADIPLRNIGPALTSGRVSDFAFHPDQAQSFFVSMASGDSTISSRAEPVPMSINNRIYNIVGGHWDSQSAVTDNYRDSYRIADQQFRQALTELQTIAADLAEVEAALQAEGAPWTPGRIPEWP